MLGNTKASLFVRLSFVPDQYLVSAVSRLVLDFCQAVVGNDDVSTRFHMAAHELAENVTKYSVGTPVEVAVELQEVQTGYIIRVSARNETTPERVRELEKRLYELKTADDPVALYDRLIRETAPLEGSSGLGLARIRAEGGFDVDYTIEGNEVTIIVQSPVQKREVRR
jgi:hypothetical protein